MYLLEYQLYKFKNVINNYLLFLDLLYNYTFNLFIKLHFTLLKCTTTIKPFHIFLLQQNN